MPGLSETRATPERVATIRSLEDRLAAQRFLLRLLAARPAPVPTPALTADQWDSFVEEASRHNLGPLAWRRLTDLASSGAPDAIIERLRPLYLRNAFRNAVLFRETAEVATALAAEDIPVMLLKGIHLAREIYEEPALRSMADIDVMVPRDRIRDADRVLVGMGYGPLPRPDIDEHCAWSNHLPSLQQPGREVLEVHFDIERPTSPFHIDTAEMWDRARSVAIDGADVAVLCDEHLLIHLCLHLAYHHKFERASLKGLVDVDRVIGRGELDWAVLVETANRWETGPFVYATLRLARAVLGSDVPDTAQASLAHDAKDDEIVDIARRYVLTPAVEVSDSILRIQRTRGWPKRLALFLGGVFLPPARLREVYGLAPGSQAVWLYYPVRVVDLLRRRGGLLARVAARTPAVSPVRDRERDRNRIEQWAGYGDARSLARKGGPIMG